LEPQQTLSLFTLNKNIVISDTIEEVLETMGGSQKKTMENGFKIQIILS
jgi:hypothetical protein